ncbi:MAG: hypothetical protein A2491_01950, partial [Bacteroidetes bacterium RIFOXYC12_FULL_35_7]
TEDLYALAANPLNLNDATEEELSKLQFLTEFEIKSILFYLKKFGPMHTLYELQMVYGLSGDKIQMMRPFVTVAPKAASGQFPFHKAFTSGQHQFFARVKQVVEEQKGFSPISDSDYAANPNQRYLGSPQRIYSKYKYKYRNKIYWGITMEKDPGEEFFRGTQKNGFDYYSAHLQINDLKLYKDWLAVKTLCLGDYELQFGQGLVMWSGLSYGKSPNAMNISKKGSGLKRYSSTNENLFMRGAASTVRFKDFDITGFWSKKKIDANISFVDSTDGEATEISSLQITGLHTIPNEMDDKHVVGENVFGGNVVYNNDNFKLGTSFIHYAFSAPLLTRSAPYNLFYFNGTSNSNFGVNYQFVFKDMHFFGEAAMSENGAMALLNGMYTKMGSQVALGILHRKYDRDYQAYYASGFSENGSVQNEEGLYIGAEVYPLKKIKLSGYFDTYKFPWLKYTIGAPSSGIDYFTQIDYFHSGNISMNLRYKNESKPENISGQTQDVKQVEIIETTKIRYQLNCKLPHNFKLKSRVDFIEYNKETSTPQYGYCIAQDVSYTFKKIPLSASFRYAIFDTDSYDTRIYTYETDVLYAFSVPALYDKGTRTYLTLKYNAFKGLDFWFRIAQTYYANKSANGSGLTEINGKTKTEVTFQVRYTVNTGYKAAPKI